MEQIQSLTDGSLVQKMNLEVTLKALDFQAQNIEPADLRQKLTVLESEDGTGLTRRSNSIKGGVNHKKTT